MMLVIILMFGGILLSLAFGLFYFIRNKNRQDEKQIVRSLTIRIILSFLLFLLLIIFYFMGWLHPHGLPF